jgi:hypothetical protein
MPEHDCTIGRTPAECPVAAEYVHDLIAVLKDQREADRAVLRQILEELRLAREARS